MTSNSSPQRDEVDEYIDQNLKKVFSELENDQMPDKIVDLLSVLRAQDKALKAKE